MTNARKVRLLYEESRRLALEEVERLARKILKEHPTALDEYVMAMGTWTFSLRGKYINSADRLVAGEEQQILVGGGDRNYFKPIETFINEWDDVLKLTGEPMRFTADGPKITDW